MKVWNRVGTDDPPKENTVVLVEYNRPDKVISTGVFRGGKWYYSVDITNLYNLNAYQVEWINVPPIRWAKLPGVPRDWRSK